ncbi:monoglyceride lipase-like isoform X1 [Haliotis rubra]|uniref:monoglyceride lipase-like isoform X1 n=1 Tax=Haliotis rubra TaxID=36100 RepID=UPI001EE54AC9|nr:monoglyceride lipase-like isoform X1 [Haliotis rubra]
MSEDKHRSEDTKYEGFFTNKDGKKIFCRYWSEEEGLTKPKALVFITHGAGEHCLWYTQLAQQLTQKDLYVFSHDHIGHGQSEGDRVHIDHFSQYTRDVFHHIELIQEKFPAVPVFLIGHSMGGTIAIKSAMERPDFFKGVILISPAVIPDPNVATPVKVTVGRLVGRMFPQFPIIKLDSKNVSRDPEVVHKYDTDPLVYHGKLKARWGSEMLATLQDITSNLGSVEWPFIVLHGTEDKMCDPAGSKLLHEKAQSKDKTLKIYENYMHQLHNELGEDGAGVRDDIINWITQRM